MIHNFYKDNDEVSNHSYLSHLGQSLGSQDISPSINYTSHCLSVQKRKKEKDKERKEEYFVCFDEMEQMKDRALLLNIKPKIIITKRNKKGVPESAYPLFSFRPFYSSSISTNSSIGYICQHPTSLIMVIIIIIIGTLPTEGDNTIIIGQLKLNIEGSVVDEVAHHR